jgi:hypothetical protein
MEKDALLEIVLHDLKEVESLVQSVKGKTTLSNAFFKLTQNRIHSILDEIEMLKEFADLNIPESTSHSTPERTNQDLTKFAEADKTEKADLLPSEEGKEKTVASGENKNQKIVQEQVPFHNHNIIEKGPEYSSPSDVSKQPEAESSQTSTPKPKDPKPPITNDIKGNRNVETDRKNIAIRTYQKESNEPAAKRETPKVLGEKFGKERASFNEHIGKSRISPGKKRSLTAPPVADLRKAIGINDRFFYQRELFNGNSDLMNQTLDQLNAMNGIDDAQNFLLANFSWDPESDAVLSFMELVERRYI